MKSICRASLLLILPLLAMVCGETELPRASARDRSDLEEQGRIGVSASYQIHGDTTTITIDWGGCSESDILVMSLDSRLARNARMFLVNPESTHLFGLVLIRSAGAAGSATLSYKRSGIAKYMSDPELVLSVFLTNLVDLVYMAQDTSDVSVEGRGNVIGHTELTSADCPDDFQIFCRGHDSRVGKNIFSSLRVFPEQGTARGRCGVNVPHESVKGLLHLNIAH